MKKASYFSASTGIAITTVLLLSLIITTYFINGSFHHKYKDYEKIVKESMVSANYAETLIRFQKIGAGSTSGTGMQLTPLSSEGGTGGRKPVLYLYKRTVPNADANGEKKEQNDFENIFEGTKESKEDIQSSITAGINATIKGVMDADFAVFDSILVSTLKNKGIDTPYKLEINYRDSLALNKSKSTPGFSESSICSFRNELPLDGENTVAYIYTSSPFWYLFKSISGVVALAIIALILIIVSIFYLVSLINSMKRTKKMQDEFTHLVTHNMSNPIAIALASAESLQSKSRENADEKYRQYISITIRQLTRLDEQVKSILKPYNLASRSSELLKQDINLANEINEILNQTCLAHPEIRFDMDIPKDISISANSSMFYEMMTNLIQNAVKYSPVNPYIKVGVEHDARKLDLYVQDNGKGIKPENLIHIFDQFFKEEKLASTPGYGLGLYYVSQIVEKHGWKINVESSVGKGSKFIITIPR